MLWLNCDFWEWFHELVSPLWNNTLWLFFCLSFHFSFSSLCVSHVYFVHMETRAGLHPSCGTRRFPHLCSYQHMKLAERLNTKHSLLWWCLVQMEKYDDQVNFLYILEVLLWILLQKLFNSIFFGKAMVIMVKVLANKSLCVIIKLVVLPFPHIWHKHPQLSAFWLLLSLIGCIHHMLPFWSFLLCSQCVPQSVSFSFLTSQSRA